MLDSYSDLIFMGVLVGVAILWRPRANNTRYGYGEFFQVESEETEFDDENIHQIPMETINVAGGELTKRKRNSSKSTLTQKPTNSSAKESYETDREKNIEKGKLKMSEFEKDIMSIELSDDGEDGDVSVENQLKKMD